VRNAEYVSLNRSWGTTIKKVGDFYFCKQRYAGFPVPAYSSFPLNQKVKIDSKLIKSLKWKFLITQTLLDLPKKDIYEYVLTTDNYDLDQFSKNIRKSIRRCLRACSFRKPTMEDLLNEGLEINRQTCSRQSRNDGKLTDKQQWSDYVESIYENKGYTILGAYMQNRMIAYLTVVELEEKFYTSEAFIDRNHIGNISPMRGLLYTLINDLIKKNGTTTISYGIHRYSKSTPLTTFKETMLFNRCSDTKGYVLNPILLLSIKLVVYAMIKLLKRKTFKQKWAKATIKLYQGHRRLNESTLKNQLTDKAA